MTREREYDRMVNEGGEGYNPHRAKRQAAEHAAATAWLQTREGRKDTIRRALERKDCALARECGTYSQEEIDALNAELAAIEAEEKNEFLGTWTLEVTKSRRESWNNRVRSGEFGKNGTPDFYRAVHAAVSAQGWTVDDLRAAVKAHGL